MAQKVQVSLIDDIDGGEAEGTVQFALDGASYEIDLNAANTARLRNALAKYVERAREAAGAAGHATRARRAPGGGLNPSEIREWAKAEGIAIKDRGRMPEEVIAKYKQATGN